MQFIIISPPKNSKSAGCKFLYELPGEIQKLGYDARRVILTLRKDGIFCISIDEKKFFLLENDTLEKFFDPNNSIIIHGENLHHRYFSRFNVARYYLNKIGALKNIGVPRDGEYKIAWNEAFVDHPDFVLRKPEIKKPKREILNLNQTRSIDLTYIGKGSLYDPSLCRLPGTIELTRAWPGDVDEYLLLLSKTRFLFTYDIITSVVTDSIMYGAVPVLMTHLPLTGPKAIQQHYNKDLFKCCLLYEEFKTLDIDKLDVFLASFYEKRDIVADLLNKESENYENQLKKLVVSIISRFGVASQFTKIATF